MLEPPDHKIDVAIVTARGLVYQWLGDVIDQSWCNNTWFNEALVSFFQMYTLNKVVHFIYFILTEMYLYS